MAFEKFLKKLRHPEGPEEGNREPTSFLEGMRRAGLFHPVTLVIGGYISGMGVFEGFKLNEYLELKSKKEKIEAELRTIDPENNRQRLKEIYGDWVEIDAGKIRFLEGRLEATEQELKYFSWLGEIKSVKPLEKMKGTQQSGEKRDPARIENNIPATAEGKSAEIDTLFLRKVLEETFPKGWVMGEVSVVKFKDVSRVMEEKYGISSSEGWADYSRVSQVITFYTPARTRTVNENIQECLTHELGHANDWESDKQTLFAEKAKLLIDITNRFDEEDRESSPYVQSIQNKDKKVEKYLKATEYWAEICKTYFSLPEFMNYKDFKLVDDWVKKHDPDFNVKSANGKRYYMINKYYEKYAQAR